MIVPAEVRKCVAFVGARAMDGTIRLAGTAFFLGRLINDGRNSFHYIITAKHVIDTIRDRGETPLMRINLINGDAAWVNASLDDWRFHPDDNEVDVAVFKTVLPPEFDHLVYPLDSAATPEVIAREGIGIGVEVFLTGLFSHHYGQRRNIPIVRVGNIAAMPEEKVETRMGLMDAYLVEARSIGGLSGSPVFAHLGLIRVQEGQVKFSAADGGIFYLLGLMHGHFASRATDPDDLPEGDILTEERINSGIAIVVPVERILEVVNQPDIRNPEKKIEAELRRKNLPTMDSKGSGG
jgi:hypothetical protein